MTRSNNINVSFGSDADYLINGLTTDVSAIECIYDLIDNSIDAARSEIISNNKAYEKDLLGLPASYKGFEIKLNVSLSLVSISDNCSGLEESDLQEKVFTIGKKSKHPFGIGHYGVGLNRAIFKLGKSVNLDSDNGKEAFGLKFTEDDVRAVVEYGEEIQAQKKPTRNKKYYRLDISDIKRDVLHEVGSDTWVESLINQVRIRYAIFCKKGLVIKVNNKKVGSFGPEIRDPMFLKKSTSNLIPQNGVHVYLEAGLHEDYRISSVDSDYEKLKPIIKNLTQEYGWYIVCNDRIILIADKTKITGWTTSWHNEYHGFLGWAYYVSEDPSLLPWDTKKTGINSNHQTHIEVINHLKEMADNYRSRNRKLRKGSYEYMKSAKAEGTRSSESPDSEKEEKRRKNNYQNSGAQTNSNSQNAKKEKDKVKIIHTKDMDFLIYNLTTVSKSPRVASFLHEAKEISIKEQPYTAMILLRVLFEAALRDFLIRHKQYQSVKEWVFLVQASKGRDFDDKQKIGFTPSLSDMLSWIKNNVSILPSDVRRSTDTSLKNFSKDIGRLNGVIHEDGVLTDFSEAKQIRNNAYRALQTFLEF